MGQEAGSNVYDELHATDESNVSITTSFYYPLFCNIVAEVKKRSINTILEVGCGTGGLAQLLMARTSIRYMGFDFSAVAVKNAGMRTGQSEAFFVGDALDPSCYQFPCDGIVCTEVLEHITRDLDVIRLWRPGVQCICSVPNFDYPTHVRHFRGEDQVGARYGDLIDIEAIVRVPKPVLLGNTVREYFRRLRWSRNEPKKMLGLLGIKTFDWYAGWFVFSGRRKWS
jgi:2-polyprenyl-3-methyl-5-hydroxy-6-metoxy-1,4-benzoquinol methylase